MVEGVRGFSGRIAVVAAPNAGYVNPGMLTVDLAAAAVIKRAAPHCTISWYTLHPPDEFDPIASYVDQAALPFTWQPLVEHFDEVCRHDVIVLWGDFLQAKHYFIEDAVSRMIRTNGRLSPPEALELLYRCLLFSEASLEVIKKIVIFGSTILFNRQRDYSEDRYGEYVLRLFRHCAGAWQREPVSAAKVQQMRGSDGTSCLGTDSAFLLRDDDLACLATTTWIDRPPFSNRVGLFVGVRTRPPRGLAGFLRRLTARLGLQLEWLPWFPVHEWLRTAVPWYAWLHPGIAAYLLRSRYTIDRLMTRGPHYSTGDLLSALRSYRFVVTDTYHLCVNAWRVGTPAICLGDPAATPQHQCLNDHKKRVLYDMYDATDFYLDTASIRHAGARRRAVDRVARTLEDESIGSSIAHRIREHAYSVERDLAATLATLGAAGTGGGTTERAESERS